MGILRTLLALCVAVFHSYSIFGFDFTGGRVAVQCFYIISGFYMALILNEKYVGQAYSYKEFIKSRLLRIYPPYLIIMLLSFAVSILALKFYENPLYLGFYVPHWEKLGFAAKFWFIVANIIPLGQEYLFFFKANLADGSLHFTHDAFMEKPRLILNGFTFVPQAWTLSIELTFYLLAPFIVKRKIPVQVAILSLSLLCRYFLISELNWKFDPWTYRFFPNELALFIGGSLAFQLYRKIKQLHWSRYAGMVLLCGLLVFILCYQHKPLDPDYKCWLLYGLLTVSLPFVFHLTKHNQTDRFIGELSYPIYLTHHLVMILLRQYYWKHAAEMEYFGIAVVLVTIPVSILFYLAAVRPLENFRLGIYSRLLSKVK